MIHKWVRWAAVIMASLLVGLALTLLARHYGLEELSWLATILGLTLPALVWAGKWARGRRPPQDEIEFELESAALSLARVESEQWKAEEAARLTWDPWPLDVSWSVTLRTERVMASWSAVLGSRDAGPISVSGSFEQIADLFQGPSAIRRLVILGERGSGKSTLALRLTLAALEGGGPHGPVPVLMQMGRWNPEQQDLDGWVADQLALEYPFLGRSVTEPDGSRRSLARALVATDLVWPVLDGMDEMAGHLRKSALERLSVGLRRDRRLVLLCRTTEYEDAVASGGPLAKTPVVELKPLKISTLKDYLPTATSAPQDRWDGIIAHLYSQPDGPLAGALKTPLMAWLARIVYDRADTTPVDMLAIADKGREAVEEHLLDSLVQAVYKNDIRSRWTSEQATPWLTFIATELTRWGARDIAWWRFRQRLSRWKLFLITFILSSSLYTILFWFARIDSEIRAVSPLPAWVGSALFVGAITAAATAISWGADTPEIVTLKPTRGQILKGLRIAGLTILLLWLASLLPQRASGSALVFVGILLGAIYSGFVAQTAEVRRLGNPIDSLHRDRASTVLNTLVTMVGTLPAFFLAARQVWDVGTSLVAAICGSIFIALLLIVYNVWTTFNLTRLWLALFGRIPFRLMTFLEDARKRGILRQAGAVYQFRHERLRDRLTRY